MGNKSVRYGDLRGIAEYIYTRRGEIRDISQKPQVKVEATVVSGLGMYNKTGVFAEQKF